MKKFNKIIILIVIWFISTMGIVTASLNFISEADTLLNLVGCSLLIAWILISVNTSCLTNISIKFNKKNK